MKIIAICGAGIGSSGILKVNAERVLGRLGIRADVTAAHLATLAKDAKDAAKNSGSKSQPSKVEG